MLRVAFLQGSFFCRDAGGAVERSRSGGRFDCGVVVRVASQ